MGLLATVFDSVVGTVRAAGLWWILGSVILSFIVPSGMHQETKFLVLAAAAAMLYDSQFLDRDENMGMGDLALTTGGAFAATVMT